MFQFHLENNIYIQPIFCTIGSGEHSTVDSVMGGGEESDPRRWTETKKRTTRQQTTKHQTNQATKQPSNKVYQATNNQATNNQAINNQAANNQDKEPISEQKVQEEKRERTIVLKSSKKVLSDDCTHGNEVVIRIR